MIFIPYRAEHVQPGAPVVTILICLLCLAAYAMLYTNEIEVIEDTEQFCSEGMDTIHAMAFQHIGVNRTVAACASALWDIRFQQDREAYIRDLIRNGEKFAGLSRKDSDIYAYELVTAVYSDFELTVPEYETKKYWYQPDTWNPLSMVTAAFVHGSWLHVIGNLFFFFAFAATVEILLGPFRFILATILIAMGSHVFYSLSMTSVIDPPPTVGLSGVVMGMMAMFTYYLPKENIRCLLWIIVFFKRFSLPAWLLTLWYVGWDVYTLVYEESYAGINIVAHVGGAAAGLLLASLVFRSHKESPEPAIDQGYRSQRSRTGRSSRRR